MKRKVFLSFVLSANLLLGENNTTTSINLETIEVVTTATQSTPTQVFLNPKLPTQPIPASDGAGFLKTIPNMSIARKGGNGGEPLFRGLGGSRLNILADGAFIHGGCGGRMDPPTAYITPELYDSVIVTKGPQSVTQGSGLVTGSVQFIKFDRYFPEPKISGDFSITRGGFDKVDIVGDVLAGMEWGYVRFNALKSESGDYKDGNGNTVHSAYERNAHSMQVGITPTEETLIEFNYSESEASAVYADRTMDGSKFDKKSYGVRANVKDITENIEKIEIIYGHSYIDHIMDNYSLRKKDPSTMYMLSNPDRKTDTLKLYTELTFGDFDITTGIDFMDDLHRTKNGNSSSSVAGVEQNHANAKRVKNQGAKNYGVFLESTYHIDNQNRLIAGFRHDETKVKYYSGGKSKDYDLNSGFLRYEFDKNSWTYYAGVGIAQRVPDFWERNKNSDLKEETNYQFDAGAIYSYENIKGSLSVFASKIDNFILVDTTKTITGRNIDVQRYGFEADINWKFLPNWYVGGTAAFTYGKNKSDGIALAQTPPFEFTTTFGYDSEKFGVGMVGRFVAKQSRYAVGQGNIIGQDIGEGKGFAVFSINSNWKITKNLTLFAGIDNIFDKQYSEFISKGSVDILGYNPVTKTQIYEPGRQVWVRLQGKF
ncbi:MAG: TonB-dependent copper receptor [Campylobacteraceae bacterium]